jgi:Cu(I)/Ag(I) efflux system membrane fusion protein
MKNRVIAVLIILLMVSFTVIIYQNFVVTEKGIHDHSEQAQLYTCGMHPDIISDEPGNCPICEMKLTPIKTGSGSDTKADGSNEKGIVKIGGDLRQTMNIKTAKVERRDLTREIITNGTVTIDERMEYKITSKISGWIEKMYVNFEGEELAAGERVFEIYSPELVAAQEELLTAVEFAKELNPEAYMNNSLVLSCMKKLRYLDLPESVIKEIIAENEVRRTITFFAATGGTVIDRYALEGDKIDAGDTILHVSDLSSLWIKADIYESELPLIKSVTPPM